MGSTFTEWRTPRILFDFINERVGGFAVDAAADQTNALIHPYYGPGGVAEDALSVPEWLSPAWCNPPYGRGIEAWLEKFIEQQGLGKDVVALLPARVETQWWARYVVPYCDILFLVGRVGFERPDREKPSQPDHASALVFYSPQPTGRVNWLDWKRIPTLGGEELKAA